MEKKMKRPSQIDRIDAYCEKHKSITDMEAKDHIRVHRLAARIWDMKFRGYVIDTEIETHTNEYGELSRYARYYIIKRPEKKEETKN